MLHQKPAAVLDINILYADILHMAAVESHDYDRVSRIGILDLDIAYLYIPYRCHLLSSDSVCIQT